MAVSKRAIDRQRNTENKKKNRDLLKEASV